MAGDWIKMREDLHEDPAVLWMAQELDVRPETIVGMCHRFWGLVSRQTRDGCLRGPRLASLGNVLGLPGFPELLIRAGWLEYDDSNPEMPITTIPQFERHLSESAKKRVLEAEKKRKQRAGKVSPKPRDKCPRKTATRGEESKSKSKKESKPKKFTQPSVDVVRAYCRERKNRVDPQRFVDFYESKGWMVGKNKMTDWHAAVRNWEKDDGNTKPGPGQLFDPKAGDDPGHGEWD